MEKLREIFLREEIHTHGQSGRCSLAHTEGTCLVGSLVGDGTCGRALGKRLLNEIDDYPQAKPIVSLPGIAVRLDGNTYTR